MLVKFPTNSENLENVKRKLLPDEGCRKDWQFFSCQLQSILFHELNSSTYLPWSAVFTLESYYFSFVSHNERWQHFATNPNEWFQFPRIEQDINWNVGRVKTNKRHKKRRKETEFMFHHQIFNEILCWSAQISSHFVSLLDVRAWNKIRNVH